MENTLEKMSIDTESNPVTKQYTSKLQQPMQHTMLIASPISAKTTTTTNTTNTTTNIDAPYATTQQQQSYSSTMNPYLFLDHDISLDFFPKESSLNQVFDHQSVVIPSASPTSSTPTSSPTVNHPPTSLLKDSLLNDMLNPSLSSPSNPFFDLEVADYPTNTTIVGSSLIGPTQKLSGATTNKFTTTNDSSTRVTAAPSPSPASASASAPTVTRPPISTKRLIRKKSSPPGQATMPIRVCAKSTRPRRHVECHNCKATKSPLWRRTPDRKETLCNACGLYYRQYHTHRAIQSRLKSPLGRTHNNNNSSNSEFAIKLSGLSDISSSSAEFMTTTNRHKKDDNNDDDTGAASRDDHDHAVRCVNCLQTRTPLWRKNKRGESVCNACGLYSRLHHRDRPVKMRKKTIQRRRRDYWNTDDGENHKDQQHQQQDICLGNSAMVSTFSATQPTSIRSEIQHSSHPEPFLSPTMSTPSSPDSTTMDEITGTTSITNNELHSASLPMSDKSVLDLGEDSRFASLLVQMDRHQMQGFLGMLEQRCNVVRTLLDLTGTGSD